MHRLLLPCLLVPLLLTGCSAGAQSAGSADTAAKAPAGAGDSGSVKAGGSTVGTPVVPRSVIRTASIVVTVKDSTKAADVAVALAAAAGGRVQEDTRSREGNGSAHLVLRVPPADVTPTLAALAKLGKEQRRTAAEKDVTDQVIDLASRITTQQASVARVRVLLGRATSLTEITTIEGELTRREADLESLQNRSKALAGQVDLATIDVSLSSSQPPAAAGGPLGFGDGFSGGWHAVTALARAAAVTVGAILPFSPLLLIAFGGRILWRRRLRPDLTP